MSIPAVKQRSKQVQWLSVSPALRQSLTHIKALLVDIDDTVICAKRGLQQKLNTGSLHDVLQRAGEELGGLSADETRRRLERIRCEVQWWNWSDFITELNLDSEAFWEYAHQMERHYIEATGPEIAAALGRLRRGGKKLYVASNNSASGILHKLRLAGIDERGEGAVFHQFLGATELQAMKWDPVYWEKVLDQIGLSGSEVAIVGDSLNDDYTIPHSAGIACTFLIDRTGKSADHRHEGMVHVSSFDDVAQYLLPPANGHSID